MSRLHPVFNVVKLSLAPPDPIPGQRMSPHPLPEIVDGEEEWVVEEILDSQMVNQNCVTWSNGGVSALNTIPGNLGIMFMCRNWWRIFTGGTLVLLVTSVWLTSAPFLSIQCWVVTALKGEWMLGDAPHRLTSPLIFLRHLCIFLPIVASPRRRALTAPIPESDDHVM